MLKDAVSAISFLLMGAFLIVIIGIFFRFGYSQDAAVLGLTETVRTSAIANADYSSRLEKGQLFILKDKFEKDFKDRISTNKNVKFSEDIVYNFEYLDNENGSTKAIRVSIIEDSETKYQATYKVDISDS